MITVVRGALRGYREPGPIKGEEPVATVTLEKFADGTYAAHAPFSNGFAKGLSKGDLEGAIRFAREELAR